MLISAKRIQNQKKSQPFQRPPDSRPHPVLSPRGDTTYSVEPFWVEQ